MHQAQHQHQMMQQNVPPSAAPSPLKAVTTEEIQKCLDENKNLILAILENQNLGKLAECAQYQAILQKNLTYLAAVADAQPPPSTPSQPQASAAQPAMSIQQAGLVQQQQQQQQHQQQQQQQHHHHHQQQQQQGVSGPRLPFQLNAHPSPEAQYQLMQLQQHQQLQGHMNLGPGGVNGMHQMMHPAMGGSGSGAPMMDMRGINKQGFDGGSGDIQGKSPLGGGT